MWPLCTQEQWWRWLDEVMLQNVKNRDPSDQKYLSDTSQMSSCHPPAPPRCAQFLKFLSILSGVVSIPKRGVNSFWIKSLTCLLILHTPLFYETNFFTKENCLKKLPTSEENVTPQHNFEQKERGTVRLTCNSNQIYIIINVFFVWERGTVFCRYYNTFD